MENENIKGNPTLKENQKNLDGEIICQTRRTTTTWGGFSLHRKNILKAFYDNYSDLGISLVELERIFKDYGENTLGRAIKYLLKNEFIALCARNVGPTKSRKYYKITEKGAIFYETS